MRKKLAWEGAGDSAVRTGGRKVHLTGKKKAVRPPHKCNGERTKNPQTALQFRRVDPRDGLSGY